MSNKKNESAAGMLLITFGTILMLTVITICTLNFIKDGRGYQILAKQVSANVEDATGGKKASSKENADSAKNGTAGNSSSKKGKGTNSSEKPVAIKKTAEKPASKTVDANAQNTGTDTKKPVKPGEEP